MKRPDERLADAVLPSGALVRVRLAEGGEDGLESVGRLGELDFKEVVAGIGEVAELLRAELASVSVARASIEFGASLSVKSGKFAAVVLEAGADASLKVVLEWEPVHANPDARVG